MKCQLTSWKFASMITFFVGGTYFLVVIFLPFITRVEVDVDLKFPAVKISL